MIQQSAENINLIFFIPLWAFKNACLAVSKSMKIIVCVAKTPDTTTKISFSDDGTSFNSGGVQFVINPLDEFALTRALELKEQEGGEVVIFTVGSASDDPIIRKALAIGADRAVRINMEPTDSLAVATQLAHHIKEEGFDLIFTGRETINYNGSQVGGMLAELLNIPFISGVPTFDISGNTATMEREIEGGKELLECVLPLVASAQEGITIPRIPNMRGIMSAKSKPLAVVEPIEADAVTMVSKYELPPQRSECRLIDAENPGELIDLLHNEAKVI